jgi:hypothetical protein
MSVFVPTAERSPAGPNDLAPVGCDLTNGSVEERHTFASSIGEWVEDPHTRSREIQAFHRLANRASMWSSGSS